MVIEHCGKTYEVKPYKASYMNGNTAVILMCEDGQEFGMLTVNIHDLEDGYAYIDTNNLPGAVDFLEDSGLGVFLGTYGQSGFCTYPMYYLFTDEIEEWSE